MSGVLSLVGAGVVTGDKAMQVLKFAKDHKFAIPAFNCISSSSINAVLEAARDVNSPVIVQFSQVRRSTKRCAFSCCKVRCDWFLSSAFPPPQTNVNSPSCSSRAFVRRKSFGACVMILSFLLGADHLTNV
jgi:hypothetical protein